MFRRRLAKLPRTRPVPHPKPVRLFFPNTRAMQARLLLIGLVMVYGAVAGLQTVADFDLGWQMAEARHPFSSVEGLSYTAAGAPWIYPAFAGILFRAVFGLGGYAAISWFCWGALLVTLAIVAVRSRSASLVLLLIAVPAWAGQMIPRSGVFTVVLAAAFARVLVGHMETGLGRGLWFLPLLMACWVNLHTGFIAGIALLVGYVAAEAIEALRSSHRRAALARLRKAAPWLTASLAATLANPWGWRIYPATALHEHISSLQAATIVELTPLYREFSWSGLRSFRPENAIWWVLAASIVSVGLLVNQRRYGMAFFLAAAIAGCLYSERSQGVFLPVACLVGGEAIGAAVERAGRRGTVAAWKQISWAGVAAAVCFVAWRCADVVTDRMALREEQITLFGAGASWWLPERAADFIERNHLPAEIFSSFNLSSYLTWRLGPRYRDFADGRYLPFGDAIVGEQLRLSSEPLDTDDWRAAAARYNIRTVIFPLARFFGIEGIPLREDCSSHEWTPVYLDSTAIVLVRNDAAESTQLSAWKVDCQRQNLVPSASQLNGGRMERYQRLANAAVVYFELGRNDDAKRALSEARQIATGDDSLVLLEGQIEAARGDLAAAERDFREAARSRASDAAWYQLGLLYAREQRYSEAVDALRRARQTDARPSFEIEWALARAEALHGETSAALQTLHEASQLESQAGSAGAAMRASIDDVEATEYSVLADWQDAIAAERAAVEETPQVPNRWEILANLYRAAGDAKDAEEALRKAETLGQQAASH